MGKKTNKQMKAEWRLLLGNLIGQPRKLEAISAFDQLTSAMLGAKIISFDEFMAAQHAVAAARAAANLR